MYVDDRLVGKPTVVSLDASQGFPQAVEVAVEATQPCSQQDAYNPTTREQPSHHTRPVMLTASQTSTSHLSLPPDTYIFDIATIPGAASFAVISSDDSVRNVDATTLREISRPGASPGVHQGVTCLHCPHDQPGKVLTAGRDGLVKVWDSRGTGAVQMELTDGM